MHILIADDDEDVVAILEYRLKSAGHTTAVATTGEEALSFVQSEKCDLLIIDLNIPPPNGEEVCAQMKKDPQLAQIPTLLLTGSIDLDPNKISADALVIKPYEWDELKKKVEMLTAEG